MLHRRGETFRYTFQKPIHALFQITEVDGNEVKTHQGAAKIIDMSPHGIKLISDLDIELTNHQSIVLSVTFELNETAFQVEGVIVWHNQVGDTNQYGMDLRIDEAVQKELIRQLKIHAKNPSHFSI